MSTKVILSAMAAISALTLSAGAFAQSGVSVVKDATTGQLRAPTAAEAKVLADQRAQQKALAKSARGARGVAGAVEPGVITHHKNGAVEMTVDPEMVSYSVMTKDADGNLVMQCVTGATAAEQAKLNPVSVSKEHKHDAE